MALKDKNAKQAYDKEYSQTHKEQKAANVKRWRAAHPERHRAIVHKYNAAHPDRVKASRKRYYQSRKEVQREEQRKRNIDIKTEILTHYGHGVLACVRCGFSDIRALSIDHIDGNGSQHRKGLGLKTGGQPFYLWLKKDNYPPEFQTLCMNCQFIRKDEAKQHGRPRDEDKKEGD